MIKVGEKVVVNDKKRRNTYSDVYFDLDDWADADKYLPEDYDLVFMRIQGDKIIPGWVVGKRWTGMRYRQGDVVSAWKRKVEEDECKADLH